MNERKVGPTERGMMLGMLFGSAAASAMFIATGEAFYFSLTGVGLAIGLGIGAALERREDVS